MAKLTLISFPTCPFVQRAIIALKEKGTPFDVVYIDLANKPDWFLAISPLGKVPVLKVERPGKEDAVVFESAVIVEYLEETAGGEPLHPADALERAQHRAWIEFGSQVLGDLYRLQVATNETDLAAAKLALAGKFQRLESVVTGPFFGGDKFSYVDATFAPGFRQIAVLNSVHETGVLTAFPKVAAWAQAVTTRPSVIASVPDDYRDLFLGQLKDRDAAVLRI